MISIPPTHTGLYGLPTNRNEMSGAHPGHTEPTPAPAELPRAVLGPPKASRGGPGRDGHQRDPPQPRLETPGQQLRPTLFVPRLLCNFGSRATQRTAVSFE